MQARNQSASAICNQGTDHEYKDTYFFRLWSQTFYQILGFDRIVALTIQELQPCIFICWQAA